MVAIHAILTAGTGPVFCDDAFVTDGHHVRIEYCVP
jgi:hypothetical protein